MKLAKISRISKCELARLDYPTWSAMYKEIHQDREDLLLTLNYDYDSHIACSISTVGVQVHWITHRKGNNSQFWATFLCEVQREREREREEGRVRSVVPSFLPSTPLPSFPLQPQPTVCEMTHRRPPPPPYREKNADSIKSVSLPPSFLPLTALNFSFQ